MVGFNKLMSPEYFPKVSIEDVDNQKIIVMWIPGGSNRPYRVPDDVKAKEKHYNYYIRYNSSSIVPNSEQELELINLSNQIPFDDRVNINATLDDISMVLIRDFLVETRSRLASQIEHTRLSEILLQMDLVAGPPERLSPKNIALMLFSNKMDKYFPCSRVDIVIYPNGREKDPSNFIEVPPIIGPVHHMIRSTMGYLKTNIIRERITKLPDKQEANKVFNYPYQALEEAVVNALYHRNYQEREPVEISIEPDKITIISYNGPDRSIKLEDLRQGKVKARRYRNRKLGDFLKELDLTEGRATGIPTIKNELKDNGSPEAVFDTDEDRSYFLVEIPCHTDFIKDGLDIRAIQIGGSVSNQYDGINDGINDRINDRIKSSRLYVQIKKVLEVIAADNTISTKDIAAELECSVSTIDRAIKQLKLLDILHREGSKKNGKWVITK